MSPTPEQTIVFYLTAGRPRGDTLTYLAGNLTNLPVEPDSFLLHLGDWNSPFSTQCVESAYQTVDALFSNSSVPVYFVPGDNEYNDCPNATLALGYWYTYLLNYPTKYWPAPSFDVQRQYPDYPENFGFVTRRILFIGINLVGGTFNQTEWDARHAANLEWIDTQYNQRRQSFDMMVIFAHASSAVLSNSPFFTSLSLRVRNSYRIRTLMVHRNVRLETWRIDTNQDGINNFDALIVQGDIWPVMRVELGPTLDPFPFDQGNWFTSIVG